MPAPAQAELTGRVRSVHWFTDEQTDCVARLDGGASAKGRSDPDLPLTPGLSYRFAGGWRRHERHGEQFHFTSYGRVVPHDRRGVVAYLVTVVDGVGEKTAARLWDAFGADAVQVLRETPEKAVEAGVMNADRANEAAQQLHDEGAFESVRIDLLGLFAGRGFQAAKLIKHCIKEWGERAPERVRKNPYLLMLKKLPSAGFRRCDKLYLDLGGRPGRLKRQALCAWHALRTDTTGHTWHAAAFAGRALEAAVGAAADPLRALRLCVRGGLLSKRKDAVGVWVAERGKARSEETVARESLRLLSRRVA